MKLLILLLLLPFIGAAQLTYYIRSDSVKIEKTGGNNELFIKNATRGVNGLLTNIGGGRTAFIGSRFIGDTLFIGRDTLTGIGTGGGSGVTGNTGSGFRIWKPGTAEIKTLFAGTGLTIDSSTNTNALTFKPDTTVLQNKNLLYPSSVEKTGITIRLVNDANTDSTHYANLGTKGWKPSAVINTTGGTPGQVVTWSGGKLFSLSDVSPPTSYFYIPTKPGVTPNAPIPADSTLQRDTLIGKTIRLHRDGHIQFPNDTLQGFTFDSTTGTLTVHPPWVLGEEVQIDVYATLDSVSMPAATIVPSWVDLTFTLASSNLVNTSQVFTGTGTGGGGWADNLGVDNLQLTGDGSFRILRNASDNTYFCFGFNNVSTLQNYTNYDFGIYVTPTGDIWPITGGSLGGSVGNIAVGDYVRINRAGSTLIMQTSSDGTTWSTVHTYSTTSSATFYTVLNMFNNGVSVGKCYHPQGFNLF